MTYGHPTHTPTPQLSGPGTEIVADPVRRGLYWLRFKGKLLLPALAGALVMHFWLKRSKRRKR